MELWFTKVTSPASILILSAISSMTGLFTSLTSADTKSYKRKQKTETLYTEISPSSDFKTGIHSELTFVFLVGKKIKW